MLWIKAVALIAGAIALFGVGGRIVRAERMPVLHAHRQVQKLRVFTGARAVRRGYFLIGLGLVLLITAAGLIRGGATGAGNASDPGAASAMMASRDGAPRDAVDVDRTGDGREASVGQ